MSAARRSGYRAAGKLVDDRAQEFPVHHVEASEVDVEHRERVVGDGARDCAIGAHLGEVADAAQQPVDDSRCAARAAGDLQCAVGFDRDLEEARGLRDYLRQFRWSIELEARDDAEAVAPPTAAPLYRRAVRYAWALLLARIYELFPLRCAKYGGEMRIIAFITDPSTVRDILGHLGEPITPPAIAPARGPPLWAA